MSRVRIVVPARNEAGRLGQCLLALLGSMDRAHAHSCELVVVVDRCGDDTAAIARGFNVAVIDCPAPFGKVEALRAGMADVVSDIVIGVDADVVVGPRTIGSLIDALDADSRLLAACPPLQPLPPLQRTPLAWALYRYNRQRGFSSERRWLNGRCWATRPFTFPTAASMEQRADDAGLAVDHPLRGPLLADDVWLSRQVVDIGGDDAIAVVETDAVFFRPPATLEGMSRYWRRLQRELGRVDVLFPELPRPPARRPDLLASAPITDHVAWWIFQVALAWCRWRGVDDDDDDDDDGNGVDTWPIVAESKAP